MNFAISLAILPYEIAKPSSNRKHTFDLKIPIGMNLVSIFITISVYVVII